jgi:hypothetical protein
VNGWDLLTRVSAAALGDRAVLIFGFFLKDAGITLKRERRDRTGGDGGT